MSYIDLFCIPIKTRKEANTCKHFLQRTCHLGEKKQDTPGAEGGQLRLRLVSSCLLCTYPAWLFHPAVGGLEA